MGVADVPDCFHRMELGEGPDMIELKKCFAYPQVRAGEMDLQELDGKPIDPDTLVYPVAERLPMGWSWS